MEGSSPQRPATEAEPVEHAAASEGPAVSPSATSPVAVVRFRFPGQCGEYLLGELHVAVGSSVVVDTERGTRLGTVVGLHDAARATAAQRVVRVASADDVEIHHRNTVREREAFAFCVEQTRAYSLPMKLVSVEFSHSGSSAVFSFTSNERVDFRLLVKELARRFHTRIDMRQIGVRDAPRYCGGVGVCGRELCCATFLSGFSPISVRMAKDQNLALNQEKLSGVCGRLKCCLAYEETTYVALRRGLPKVGKRVLTPAGEGRVKDVNVVKRIVRVQLATGEYREFQGDEVKRPADANGVAEVPEEETPEGTREEAPRVAATPGAPATVSTAAESQPRSSRRRRRRKKRGATSGVSSPNGSPSPQPATALDGDPAVRSSRPPAPPPKPR